jgi:hypothetical protein
VLSFLLGVVGIELQLQNDEITSCLPEHGGKECLPPGVGAIFLRIAPETKY